MQAFEPSILPMLARLCHIELIMEFILVLVILPSFMSALSFSQSFLSSESIVKFSSTFLLVFDCMQFLDENSLIGTGSRLPLPLGFQPLLKMFLFTKKRFSRTVPIKIQQLNTEVSTPKITIKDSEIPPTLLSHSVNLYSVL